MQPSSLYSALAEALSSDWSIIARPEQVAPPGTWNIWTVMAGRGWGKTRTGAEWVLSQIGAGIGRVGLIGPTMNDARAIMVEGESGILACAPSHDRPIFQSTLRRIVWPSGAIAELYSADEPERLRGPQFGALWADEVGTWRYGIEAWNNAMLGLRLGSHPRAVVTTTPRPTRLMREILARPDVVVTRGKTSDNAANLAPTFLRAVQDQFSGTRLGRQELDGELLEDTPGALWQSEWIERTRVSSAPELVRVVVAIDPAVTSKPGSDESGIIAAGIDEDGHVYVLDDVSGKYAPHEWAAAAIRLYGRLQADRIIAEVNNGGEMVGATLRQVDPHVSFRAVTASRGKVTRAEPVAAAYEQGKVHHVGVFATLEDQLCSFTSDFDRSTMGSPDRLDALVWALTELMPQREIADVSIGAPISIGRVPSAEAAPHLAGIGAPGGGISLSSAGIAPGFSSFRG